MTNICIKSFKVFLAGLVKIASPSYVKKYSKILVNYLKFMCFWSQFVAISPHCGNHKDLSQNSIGIWSFQEVQLYKLTMLKL